MKHLSDSRDLSTVPPTQDPAAAIVELYLHPPVRDLPRGLKALRDALAKQLGGDKEAHFFAFHAVLPDDFRPIRDEDSASWATLTVFKQIPLEQAVEKETEILLEVIEALNTLLPSLASIEHRGAQGVIDESFAVEGEWETPAEESTPQAPSTPAPHEEAPEEMTPPREQDAVQDAPTPAKTERQAVQEEKKMGAPVQPAATPPASTEMPSFFSSSSEGAEPSRTAAPESWLHVSSMQRHLNFVSAYRECIGEERDCLGADSVKRRRLIFAKAGIATHLCTVFEGEKGGLEVMPYMVPKEDGRKHRVDPTADVSKIEQEARDNPYYSVWGLPLEDAPVACLDLDNKNDKRGVRAFRRYLDGAVGRGAFKLLLSRTWVDKTKSGGLHIFIAAPESGSFSVEARGVEGAELKRSNAIPLAGSSVYDKTAKSRRPLYSVLNQGGVPIGGRIYDAILSLFKRQERQAVQEEKKSLSSALGVLPSFGTPAYDALFKRAQGRADKVLESAMREAESCSSGASHNPLLHACNLIRLYYNFLPTSRYANAITADWLKGCRPLKEDGRRDDKDTEKLWDNLVVNGRIKPKSIEEVMREILEEGDRPMPSSAPTASKQGDPPAEDDIDPYAALDEDAAPASSGNARKKMVGPEMDYTPTDEEIAHWYDDEKEFLQEEQAKGPAVAGSESAPTLRETAAQLADNRAPLVPAVGKVIVQPANIDCFKAVPPETTGRRKLKDALDAITLGATMCLKDPTFFSAMAAARSCIGRTVPYAWTGMLEEAAIFEKCQEALLQSGMQEEDAKGFIEEEWQRSSIGMGFVHLDLSAEDGILVPQVKEQEAAPKDKDAVEEDGDGIFSLMGSFDLSTGGALDSPPEVAYLLEGSLPAEGLSMLVASPACGKGFMAMQLQFALAYGGGAGRHVDFLPWKPSRQVKSLYVSAEDDAVNLQRRQWFYVNALYPTASEEKDAFLSKIRGKAVAMPSFLTFEDRRGRKKTVNLFPLFRCGRDGIIQETDGLERLKNLVVRNGTQLLILDTLQHLAEGVEENSSAGWGSIASKLMALAVSMHIQILLIHHTRKGDNRTGEYLTKDNSLSLLSQETSRGSSAIAATTRWVANMAPVSADYAQELFADAMPEDPAGTYVAVLVTKKNNGRRELVNYFRRGEGGILKRAELAGKLQQQRDFTALVEFVKTQPPLTVNTSIGSLWKQLKDANWEPFFCDVKKERVESVLKYWKHPSSPAHENVLEEVEQPKEMRGKKRGFPPKVFKLCSTDSIGDNLEAALDGISDDGADSGTPEEVVQNDFL